MPAATVARSPQPVTECPRRERVRRVFRLDALTPDVELTYRYEHGHRWPHVVSVRADDDRHPDVGRYQFLRIARRRWARVQSELRAVGYEVV